MTESHMKLPHEVLVAIERLESAGYEAYAVGGCVRDTLLGRSPNDWDITTSARPEETAAVFFDCRTIETGIKHGTLTVIVSGMPLEITTYRSDGAYADNRHPIEVSFAKHVEDDLSRRDFTVNAMAYHPTRGFVDLFGGQNDLSHKSIACVGDPATRFHEDGLRILRAIRFASVLDFTIDPPTAREVHACRHLLKNIAAERIREEFCKLLCGVGAVRILREFADVIAEFLSEITPCVGFDQNCRYHCYDVWEHTLHALEANTDGDLITRLAILFHDIGKPHCYTEDENGGHFKGHGKISTNMTDSIMRRLRFDNDTTERVTRLVERHDCVYPAEPRTVKRLMQKMSDEDILRLMEIQRCDRVSHAKDYATPSPTLQEIPALMRRIREEHACFSLKDLQVKGTDLISIGIPAGKQLGAILTILLDAVIDGELPNERAALLSYAAKKAKEM